MGKFHLQYKCKRCGAVHTTEKADTWQIMDHPPFITSQPVTNLVLAATGVVVPNMIMWHQCPDGFGMAEFIGILPAPESV